MESVLFIFTKVGVLGAKGEMVFLQRIGKNIVTSWMAVSGGDGNARLRRNEVILNEIRGMYRTWGLGRDVSMCCGPLKRKKFT